LWFHAGASASIPKGVPRPPQERTGVFGIFSKDAEGKVRFQKTDRVPLIEGQSYGWVIRLTGQADKVKWKEEFVLPEAPETWGEDDGSATRSISQDRKVLVTEKEEVPGDGTLFHFWSVVPGDPPGPHVIRVYVNDVLVETFRFTVIAPPSPGTTVTPD